MYREPAYQNWISQLWQNFYTQGNFFVWQVPDMSIFRRFGLFALVLCISGLGVAQDETGDAEAVGGSNIYVPIKPAFVVNYGGPGKLQYLKLEISLRVADTPASNAVRHHMPLIRDFLVREFSRLQDSDIDTQQGKEAVRQSALAGIRALIEKEDGEEGLTDLFFNNFVIQR